MAFSTVAFLFLVAITCTLCAPQDATALHDESHQNVLQRKVIVVFDTEEIQSDYAGKASLSAKATFDGENGGVFAMEYLNVVFASVDTHVLANKGHHKGMRALGFASHTGFVNVTSNCLSSDVQIEGTAHTDLYEELDHESWSNVDYANGDVFGPFQPVATTASLSMTEANGSSPLVDLLDRLSTQPPTNEIVEMQAHMRIVLWLHPSTEQLKLGILPIRIEMQKNMGLKVEILPHALKTNPKVQQGSWKRRLCIQPVRISYSLCGPYSCNTHTSGAGYAFGLPDVLLQWGKVNVEFETRPWKTIYNNNFAVITENNVQLLLRSVDDADCIEIYFAPSFSPRSLYGGGVCFSSGTVSAKVVMTDEVISCGWGRPGVGITVLAHEVGHVLSLVHPGPNPRAGNTGTLMCPSNSFQNNNPRINSVGNSALVSNPLLRGYGSVLPSGVADCFDSRACGPCFLSARC